MFSALRSVGRISTDELSFLTTNGSASGQEEETRARHVLLSKESKISVTHNGQLLAAVNKNHLVIVPTTERLVFL